MVTFEELRARYPPKPVSPFGDCSIVPGVEFDPDWEAELRDQGCMVHFADLGGKPVTLVSKKVAQVAGEKVVYRPPEAKSSPILGTAWSENEDSLLIALWNKKLKTKEIAKNFPGRTEVAVKLRSSRLASMGLIRPRWKCRKRGAEPDPKPKSPHSAVKEEPKLPTALPTTVYTSVYASLDKVLVDIRDEVYAMVKEHGDFRSLHEGYAVILEELEELWCEVKRPAEKRDIQRLRAEALDVAASAVKFALFVEKEAKS